VETIPKHKKKNIMLPYFKVWVSS